MSQLINFKILQANSIVDVLLNLIENNFDKFTNSKEFFDVLQIKKNENQHSLSFCLYMTNICNCDFYFARENSQVGSNVVDIGVYKGSNLIFTIEAKILPTPKGNPSSPRNAYEYVYGNGGGIQRFKDQKHGVDNLNNLLPENGMIAYIKEQQFSFWKDQINKWVEDAGWEYDEKLNLFDSLKNNRLISKHKALNGLTVKLHHFWIKVNNDKVDS